jgi:hypothetical protein
MNETSGGTQFELPPEQSVSPELPAEELKQKDIEQQRPAAGEAGVGKRAPQSSGTAVTDVPVLPQTPVSPTTVPADKAGPAAPISPTTADLTAKDADLIEKGWIEKTKTVVAQTQDDPHLQKKELSKVKADYIQKRFNKTIKTDEATA